MTTRRQLFLEFASGIIPLPTFFGDSVIQGSPPDAFDAPAERSRTHQVRPLLIRPRNVRAFRLDDGSLPREHPLGFIRSVANERCKLLNPLIFSLLLRFAHSICPPICQWALGCHKATA